MTFPTASPNMEAPRDSVSSETGSHGSTLPVQSDPDETGMGEPKALHDVEKASLPSNASTQTGSQNGDEVKNPDLVTWSGPDDPENPKNWPMRKKWTVTMLVSAFTFISPVSSSMVAPALQTLARDFHITSSVESQMALSIFVLAYAIGPLFFGPLSESFGRVPILQLSNLFYLAWNLGCGFAQNSPEMLVFRFLSGIGGSAPLAVGGGVLSDCWHPEQRGKAVGIYSLAPLLGPVIGPLAGGFIAQYSTWRWVFWATTIIAAIIQVAGFFYLAESHHPTVLKNKRDRLARETGNQNLYVARDNNQTLLQALASSMIRPTRMLATQPIVQLIALYMGYLFGLFYLILSTFPAVFGDVYHQSLGIGGLHYISLGVGFTLGAQINAQATDRLYRRLKARQPDGQGRPEFRIPAMFVGSVLIPVGLFWYGWSVQARLHWIMPDIGIAIFAAGAIACLQCMQGYLIDTYARFAASAMAAAVVLRSLAGFGFPLFAPYMYASLGYGWGNSVLGFVSIAVGIPAPYLFWFYGSRLRALSKYAAN